jgi:hypothetical protein
MFLDNDFKEASIASRVKMASHELIEKLHFTTKSQRLHGDFG